MHLPQCGVPSQEAHVEPAGNPLLLSHSKLDSAVMHHEIEVHEILVISEQTEV